MGFRHRRQDPRKTLRQVEAIWKIIAEYQELDSQDSDPVTGGQRYAFGFAIRALASTYPDITETEKSMNEPTTPETSALNQALDWASQDSAGSDIEITETER